MFNMLLLFNGLGQSLNKKIAYSFTRKSLNKDESAYMCAIDDLNTCGGGGEVKHGPKLLQIL